MSILNTLSLESNRQMPEAVILDLDSTLLEALW